MIFSPLINSARSPRTNIHLLPRARFHPGPGISSRRIVGRVLPAPCDERMLVPLAANQECLQAQGLKKKQQKITKYGLLSLPDGETER